MTQMKTCVILILLNGENFDGVGSDKDELNDKDDSGNAGFIIMS